MYKQTPEYKKAMEIAKKYIRRYYHSHPPSRRLHYQLKQQKYIDYDKDIYTLEIQYYDDGDIGLRIWDNNMEEVEYEENITNKPVTRREIKPACPYEHIYESNEETYFYKPAGLY